ncbi:hypothetical protein Ddc_11931 [Ditylenchus destructor]|nr:hypothetical protein Ddc_11931 [Ditylenchus destructor]
MVSHQSAMFTGRWRRRTPPFFVYLAFCIPSLCAYFIAANVSLPSSVCAYFSPRCSKELMMMKRGERYEHHEYDNKNVNKHMCGCSGVSRRLTQRFLVSCFLLIPSRGTRNPYLSPAKLIFQ